MKEDEYGCAVCEVGQRFVYIINRKHYVLEAQESSMAQNCNAESDCFFRDKQDECPKFACSGIEREDDRDIKFIDVTSEYDKKELVSFLWANGVKEK